MTVSAEFSATYNIPRGVLVDSVLDAALNGGCELLAGDVIIAIDRIAIEDMDALNDMKYRHTVGETMVATVLRGGNVIEVKSPLFPEDILSDE